MPTAKELGAAVGDILIANVDESVPPLNEMYIQYLIRLYVVEELLSGGNVIQVGGIPPVESVVNTGDIQLTVPISANIWIGIFKAPSAAR